MVEELYMPTKFLSDQMIVLFKGILKINIDHFTYSYLISSHQISLNLI